MERKNSEELLHNKKKVKQEQKYRKQTQITSHVKNSNQHRSTSNNKPGVNKEKYKQSESSGPITAKNKLPDAFMDANKKGKVRVKSINKPSKKYNEGHNKSSRNLEHDQGPKSSHGRSK
jgi:hypothetical protein